jgi:hypothetical protein
MATKDFLSTLIEAYDNSVTQSWNKSVKKLRADPAQFLINKDLRGIVSLSSTYGFVLTISQIKGLWSSYSSRMAANIKPHIVRFYNLTNGNRQDIIECMKTLLPHGFHTKVRHIIVLWIQAKIATLSLARSLNAASTSMT